MNANLIKEENIFLDFNQIDKFINDIKLSEDYRDCINNYDLAKDIKDFLNQYVI